MTSPSDQPAKRMTVEELASLVASKTRPTEDEKREYLRDHFAAMAMQGMMSCPEWKERVAHASIAEEAYNMADAMLEARDVR